VQTITIDTVAIPLRNLRQDAISRGARWDDIKSLNQDELSLIVGAMKHQVVQDPQEIIRKLLTNIKAKSTWHRLADIKGALDLIERFEADSWDFDQVDDEDEEVLAEILERVVAKRIAKIEERANRLGIRATNRAMYLPQVTLAFTKAKTGKLRWTFSVDLISAGLMARMLESVGEKVEGTPVALRIVNDLPLEANESGNMFQPDIPESEWAILREHGWLPTQGNLAWNWENPKLKEVFLKTFPKAIDMGAYNHRLGAPIVPGGYIENLTIRFSNPMAIDVEPRGFVEATQAALDETRGEKSEWVRDQECDGSGQYNPDHPAMQELVSRYGKVVFQITVLRPDGLFAKGIIVPRQDIVGDEPIVLDMAQVKGAWKSKVAEGQIEQGCFVGIMKAWDRQAYFPGSFELLEFIRTPKDAAQREEMQAALKSLLDEAIGEIAKDGIDGLMAEIAKDDELLKLVVKIIAQIRAHGVKLNPMSVPMIRAAIDDKLRAKLWVIAQGAGLRGKQYVTVLDATVPEGQCVLSGYKIGSELALWRFPCVLPQGLVKATVIPPRPHHLIDGKVVPHTVWLNPRDLTCRMQGDDDGDIVGISNDPRVLKLFAHKASERVYLVEPVGQKFDVQTDSPEGYKYLETDPRGPVGSTTMWQAALLSVGDWWGAIAMAVMNQEAIDSAKRKIAWTDVSAACEPNNWYVGQDGNMHLKDSAKLSLDNYGTDPKGPAGWPGDYTYAWFVQRMESKFGCVVKGKYAKDPLAWRSQKEEVDGQIKKLKKRIAPSYWEECASKDKGFGRGNLVHWCHDESLRIWKSHTKVWDEMFGDPEQITDIRELLKQLLAQQGLRTELTCSTWDEYMVLRKESGILAYGQGFKDLLSSRPDEDVKFSAIADLNQQLQLSLKQLSVAEQLTIWYWELTPTWKIVNQGQAPRYVHERPETGFMINKENYAFRAIAFPGSQVLTLLGIDDAKGCPWITSNDRAGKISTWALAKPQPFQALAQWAFKDTKHGDATVNEAGLRIDLKDCPHCVQSMTDMAIRQWRSAKTAGEKDFMKSLVSNLNKIEREGPSEEMYSTFGDDYNTVL